MIELPIKAGMIKPDEILSTEEAKARIEKRNADIYVSELAEQVHRQRQKQPRGHYEQRSYPGFSAGQQWARNGNTANTSWTASFNFGASGR